MFPVSSLYLLSILLNLMFNTYFLVHMCMYVDNVQYVLEALPDPSVIDHKRGN